MSSDPVLQTRTRRSRTITPLIPNGTPRISDTPKQSKSEHDSSYLHAVYPEGFEGSPVIGGRHVDASFRNEDKVSPMLAKLRMTPGIHCLFVLHAMFFVCSQWPKLGPLSQMDFR